MKTKNKRKIFAFIASGLFCLGQVHSQTTALSGTYAPSNQYSAGTLGTENTSVGGFAGLNLTSYQGRNVFVGYEAGATNGYADTQHTANENTFLGWKAGFSNSSGMRNVFVGCQAGFANETGVQNSYFGKEAGGSGINANDNSFFGYQCGYSNTANNNSFFGNQTGYSNTSGSGNALFGSGAGYYNSTGANNSIFGFQAGGYGSGATNNFSNNSFFGFQSGNKLTTGANNVFMGYLSGYNNTSGGNNIFMGYQAGKVNTLSSENVVIGYNALYAQSYSTAMNTYNVAVGNNALAANNPTSSTTGYFNTALGHNAGTANTTGKVNTFIGADAGMSNNTGNYNCITGFQAGYDNTTASHNTFNGYVAGYYTTTGDYNTSIGDGAGLGNTTAGYNTYLGVQANSNNHTNCTSLGYTAYCTGDNQVTLGNSSIGALRCQVALTVLSDRRVKENIQANVPGLAFIKLLQPVTFHYNVDKEDQITRNTGNDSITDAGSDFPGKHNIEHVQVSGFIAQSVDSAAQKVGYDFNGVYKPQDESKDLWGLSYSSFVPSLVLAIQELSKTADSLKAVIAANPQSSLRTANNQIGTNNQNLPVQYVTLASQKAILYQNNPNPADDQTSIEYFLSEGTVSAEMAFYDMYGKEIKRVALENKGNAKLEVNTRDLDAGIYSYSLIVDGMVVDTLKMARAK